MRFRLCLALLLPLLVPGARAQDERRVASPDGNLEFRIFVAQPEPGGLNRLGYRLLYRGKPLIQTSYLGLDIHNQEPLLCENVGLIHSNTGTGGAYRWLTAEYMQNGSLGRLVNLEIRVWNEGAAFRYVIPRSTPLEELLIDEELTEFDVPGGKVDTAATPLPFVTGAVAIAAAHSTGYPETKLMPAEGSILVTHLTSPLEGRTPFTAPWRVILIGKEAERPAASEILSELNR